MCGSTREYTSSVNAAALVCPSLAGTPLGTKIRTMRYWWVNQNQTFRHEVEGGYLWPPKRNANGARNPFYETMRDVSPGDLILSFADTRIAADRHRRFLLL